MQMSPALAEAVGNWTRIGWRVEAYGPGQVAMVTGRRPNHVLHLLLSIVTMGLWLVVWALVAMTAKEQRQVLTVQPDGTVLSSRQLRPIVETLPRDSWATGRGLPIERR